MTSYELALLLAYKNLVKTTALDIAREWVARVPMGWSAEDFALRNLKLVFCHQKVENSIMPSMNGLELK